MYQCLIHQTYKGPGTIRRLFHHHWRVEVYEKNQFIVACWRTIWKNVALLFGSQSESVLHTWMFEVNLKDIFLLLLFLLNMPRSWRVSLYSLEVFGSVRSCLLLCEKGFLENWRHTLGSRSTSISVCQCAQSVIILSSDFSHIIQAIEDDILLAFLGWSDREQWAEWEPYEHIYI